LIQNHYLYSPRVLTFVIGSSDGIDVDVKERSDYQLSFSKMTFPHQLMRMLFLEQIYRSLSIINHQKYHK
jgi:23S rRNA (pseudouridine1915-N3)-methyltransferase